MDTEKKRAILFAVKRILAGGSDLDCIKREAGKRFRLSHMIKNPEILAMISEDKRSGSIRALLMKKPTKTISGVTPIAVMIAPLGSCNHKCAYCSFTGLAAKSYTGFEPAALRARQYSFDPFLQSSSRAKQFEEGGHPADKCELIIMGGTFLETPKKYRESFIKGVYDGLNGSRSKTLAQALSKNEKAPHRAIGLTIETRPDVCRPYIPEMLLYGATRVELGVQHADDKIYRRINRGHTVKDVVDSTRDLKDASFKVLYHIMPGLPGAGKNKDISFVKRLFSDQRFQPDMLKIYPTLVMEGTRLSEMYENDEYKPYQAGEAADVISEFYRYIPKYVRVMRIQRDIPAGKIVAGVKSSNLRELVEKTIREKKIKPKEIRYREIGFSKQKGKDFLDSFSIKRIDYPASGGKEIFLSSEDDFGTIAGFIRLRLPVRGSVPEIDSDTALIRELHIYGSEVPIHGKGSVQHRGLGRELLMEAERIARDEMDRKRMIIISGVGVRDYYRKFGYKRIGPYMGKKM